MEKWLEVLWREEHRRCRECQSLFLINAFVCVFKYRFREVRGFKARAGAVLGVPRGAAPCHLLMYS